MKTWVVSFQLHDDGLEDPSGEIQGKYFTLAELRTVVSQSETAGLTITHLKIASLKMRKGVRHAS